MAEKDTERGVRTRQPVGKYARQTGRAERDFGGGVYAGGAGGEVWEMRRFDGEVRFGGDCVARVTDEKGAQPLRLRSGQAGMAVPQGVPGKY